MIVDCTFPVPESWPKYKRHEALAGAWHTLRPDISNVIKGIEDSCNGILYTDDSQIAVSIGFKKYGSAPQAKVTIYELDCVENPLWLIANIKRAVEAGTL
jgi:Holliday junction resolvase RusA-like endonuclease